MNNVMNILNNFQEYIIIGLFFIVVILIIIMLIIIKSLNKLERKYKTFMRGVSNKNIEELIIKYLDKIDDAKEEVESVKKLCDDISSRLDLCIQKYSIIRYKAFEDIGSDLSFSIALLDNNNNGVVITSIYGRNESMIYAKPLDRGISRYDLSDEEKKVIDDAINRNVIMQNNYTK